MNSTRLIDIETRKRNAHLKRRKNLFLAAISDFQYVPLFMNSAYLMYVCSVMEKSST